MVFPKKRRFFIFSVGSERDILDAVEDIAGSKSTHIGVFQALKELQIQVRAVVGCSIGAQIGAMYCS